MERSKPIVLMSILLLWIGMVSVVYATELSGDIPRIINGSDVDAQEYASDYPWMVSIQSSNANNTLNGHFCGGILIAPEWVMTAAHCVTVQETALPWAASLISVLSGSYHLTGDGSQITHRVVADRVLIHESYRPMIENGRPSTNDIALLHLSQAIVLNRYPASLSTSTFDALVVNQFMTALGWGKTQFVTVSPVLQKTQLQYQKNSNQCTGSQMLDASQFCAGSAGTDTCTGDSGGPLLYRANMADPWSIVGLTSFGPRNCLEGTAGYTKVSLFWQPNVRSSWVEQQIASNPVTTSQSSVTRTLYFINHGDTSLILGLATLHEDISSLNVGEASRASSSHFSLLDDQCENSSLASGASCSVQVAFQDGVPGQSYMATISYTDSSQSLTLSQDLCVSVAPTPSSSSGGGGGLGPWTLLALCSLLFWRERKRVVVNALN